MVKIGKFGGIERSLAFVHRALAEGREVCMSGMYDTGVSRFAHAAFQTLPGVVIPGDLGATVVDSRTPGPHVNLFNGMTASVTHLPRRAHRIGELRATRTRQPPDARGLAAEFSQDASARLRLCMPAQI